MMDKELVSIVIPVYNIDEYVQRCINSIISQTYSNLEIIIVDDGSTDNSPKICDDIRKSDCRIVVYHKKNGGLSDARNYGIDKANGKYITFVDGDDWIEESFVEELMKIHHRGTYDFVQCQFLYAFDGGNKKYLDAKQNPISIFNRKEAIKSFVESGPLGVSVAAWGKIYRKEVFESIRYPKGKVHEDVFTMCDIVFTQVTKVVVSAKPLYNYYFRENGISKTINYGRLINQIESQIYVSERVETEFPEYKYISDKLLYEIMLEVICNIQGSIKDIPKELFDVILKGGKHISLRFLRHSGYKIKRCVSFAIIKRYPKIYVFMRGKLNGK